MRPARDWITELKDATSARKIEIEEGRGGHPTIKMDGVYLHSRYDPVEEAARLIDSADLDPARPVLVIGLGLGYHVRALQDRGFHVLAIEPDPAVAKLAIDSGLIPDDLLLAVGESSPDETDLQLFVHPPTDRVHPGFADKIRGRIARSRFDSNRLNIAVVGPMYGGSLPIAEYLSNAFRRLGHRVTYVDNGLGWPPFDGVQKSVRSRKARQQLSDMYVNFMGEFTYARVVESHADICIVLAQAPVQPIFAERLRKQGIVTAFWFVENWRHLTYWEQVARHYDWFFHIQPGEFDRKLDAIGCRHHAHIQTACDPEIHRPVELTGEELAQFGCDISFAGAGYHNRKQIFQGLTDYDLKIWGVDWDERALLPCLRDKDERFTPERFRRIVAGSKINLNLHSSATHSGVDPNCDAINPRVFEIAACGGFQLCDPCAGLEQYFDYETELPVYRSLSELRDRIDYYMSHPDEREAITAAARKRVLRDHTYDQRAQQMLDLILESFAPRIAEKGVLVQRTVKETRTKLEPDSELAHYLATLPDDLPFTQESMAQLVPPLGKPLNYPETVFAYLREMKRHSEMLLDEAGAD